MERKKHSEKNRQNRFSLTKEELSKLKKLNTPIKIQDYLDQVPLNFEKKGETYMSPRLSLAMNKMHCFEGALVAALALWVNGEEPLLLDLKATSDDVDHVVALYKQNGYWGAISKTNHSTLRFRDPVYKTIRELALSYFHEYFDVKTGKKNLRGYSKPFNLKKMGTDWIISEDGLDDLVEALDHSPHTSLLPPKNKKNIRKADMMELQSAEKLEWQKNDART